jgi:hypothetical protein
MSTLPHAPRRLSRLRRPSGTPWLRAVGLGLAALALAVVPAATGPSRASAQIPGGAQFDSLITPPPPPPPRGEIQQFFLRFEHSDPRGPAPRTRFEADSLARHVLALARAGVDFDTLIVRHADLKRGTRLRLVGRGVRPEKGERSTKAVEPAVADMAFGMSVGETGLVVPNNTTCKYGYYVIRRRS